MPKDYAYREFEDLFAWNIVNRAIGTLVKNKDLVEKTDRRYIVGFLLKVLSDNGALKAKGNVARRRRIG